MKKFLLMIAVVLLGASSLKAQSLKDIKWAAEVGVGSELELGVRTQYNFNEYLAWDVLHVKYAYDYNKYDDWSEISFTTGLRGFSPSFGPDVKAFAAVDLGYGGMFSDYVSCFAMDFTVGLQIKEHLYLGYGLGLMHHDGNHKDHLFRIGWTF